MPDRALEAEVRAVLDRLLAPVLRESATARAYAGALRDWLSAAVGEGQAPPSVVRAEEGAGPAGATAWGPELHAPRALPVVVPQRGPKAVVPLRIGGAEVEVVVPVTSAGDVAAAQRAAERGDDGPGHVDPALEAGKGVDLDLIAWRCDLKARACRVAMERRAAAGDPVREPAALSELNAMIAQGKASTNCYLWMFNHKRPLAGDEDLRTIAACYTALGGCAAHVGRVLPAEADAATDDLRAAMALLAEACSALRVALRASWLDKPDHDQDDAHLWLKRETAVRRVLIDRHMRLDDPADPTRAGAILDELHALRERANAARRDESDVHRRLSTVGFHAKKLAHGSDDPADDVAHIEHALAALEGLGVPPADRRVGDKLCEAAARAVAALAGPPARALSAARRVIERAERAAGAEIEGKPARVYSANVARVRDLIGGRAAVVVGGEARAEHRENLREAFGLTRVDWVQLNEHASAEPLRAPIARPDVALVMVLIKLGGHHHIDEARRLAGVAGVPYVNLPAGYNAEQVAAAVLAQAGARLHGGK